MFDRSVLDVNHTVVTCITTLPTANALVIISSPDARIRADTQHVIIAAASATIAVLTAVIALAALQNALVVLVFLSSSMLIGGAMGVTNNAYAEIISRMPRRCARGTWPGRAFAPASAGLPFWRRTRS
jgi:hypothetical protein